MKNKLKKLLQKYLGKPELRRLLAGASLGTVTLLCAVAEAAGAGGHGEHHGVNWWHWEMEAPPVGWFIIDFILFVGLMYLLTRKMMRGMFKKRHEDIKTAIDDAQGAYDRAKAHHDEYDSKLGRVSDEVGALIEGGKREGAELRDEIVAAAKEYAGRLRKDTDTVVQQELQWAQERLHRETAAAAVNLAEKILRDEIGPKDQEQLLEQAIEELEAGGQATRKRPMDSHAVRSSP